MTTLYGLAHCGTCKKATAWLGERDIPFEFIDYRENPLDPAELRGWAAELGWPKVVNRASMTWRNLAEERKNPESDDDWLALVAEHPALVRRPLVVHGEQVHTGFSDKAFTALFSG